jgi:hypothetical protein
MLITPLGVTEPQFDEIISDATGIHDLEPCQRTFARCFSRKAVKEVVDEFFFRL